MATSATLKMTAAIMLVIFVWHLMAATPTAAAAADELLKRRSLQFFMAARNDAAQNYVSGSP